MQWSMAWVYSESAAMYVNLLLAGVGVAVRVTATCHLYSNASLAAKLEMR